MPAGQFAPSRIHLDYPEWTPPAVGDTGKPWVWNNATQKYEQVSGVTFASGLATLATALASPVWKPLVDSSLALQIQTAGGGQFIRIDTVNRRVGVNRNPSSALFEFAQTGAAIERAMDFYDNNGNGRLTLFTNGQMNYSAIPATALLTANASSSIQFYSTRWDGSTSQAESIELYDVRYDSGVGRHALWIRDGTGNVLMAISGGAKGQVAIGNSFPSDLQTSKGKLWIVSPDTAWKAATFHVLTGASVDIVDFQKNGVVQFAVGNDGKLKTNQSVTNTNAPSGATVKALPLYKASGTLDGYIPVYASPW